MVLRLGDWVRMPAIVAFCVVASGCSPYVFSDEVKTLSDKVAEIDVAYKAGQDRLKDERRLLNRLTWTDQRLGPSFSLAAGPGCDGIMNSAEECDIEPTSAVPRTPRPVLVAPKVESEPDESKPAEKPIDICASTQPRKRPGSVVAAKAEEPLTRAGVVKAMATYTAQLAAITNAKDRADFDSAATKASAAVGGLAKSVGTVTAAAAPVEPLAKAASNAGLWLVGQALDHQRLRQLQYSVEAACQDVHILSEVLGEILEKQKLGRLAALQAILRARIRAANSVPKSGPDSAKKYGAAVEEAYQAVDAIRILQASDPIGTMAKLRDAHDDLLVALRRNDGEFRALIVSLQAFVDRANEVVDAADQITAAGNNTSTAKKS